MKIKVGCCGFSVSKIKYFENLKLIEIQKTFYRLLEEEVLKKWRKEAPKDFEFTFKAFQGLTHSINSSTWKKSGLRPKEIKKIKNFVGNLKINKITIEFWEKMKNYAKILKSKIIVIQLPLSFTDTEKNISQAEEFLKTFEMKKIKIAIELRGWKEKNKKRLLENFENVIDVVDINVSWPSIIREVFYTRLHGKIEKNKIYYDYDYSLEELSKIKNKVRSINSKENYVLFNNLYMFKNALDFLKI